MKRLLLVLFLGLSALLVYAQKENGTVYIEHDAIAKTKALWAAFVKGDNKTFTSFFADTVYQNQNGEFKIVTINELNELINWWKGFENLSISDDKPAFPDAILYNDGGLWVQDWQLWKGTHKETGINLNLKIHSLYRFNDDNKINSIHFYFDNDIFQEINKSYKTTENGKIYINHPFIITVRKLVNAYCDEDIERIKTFFIPEAKFATNWDKVGVFINLENQLKHDKDVFDQYSDILFEQIGYPDCIYYAQEDNYQVLSYWSLSFIDKNGKKHEKIPYMFTHIFNNDGKIFFEFVSVSSNHFN